jgi:RNA polymerase sigma-70 factor (ECF subfamily)
MIRMTTVADPTRVPFAEGLELAARLRAGDRQAHERVVRAHAPALFATCARLLGTHGLDQAGAAVAAAFAALSSYDGGEPLRPWLRHAAIAAALARLRPRAGAAAIVDLLPTFLADGHRDLTAAEQSRPGAEIAAPRDAVLALIERLPDDHRIVLVLRDGEGLGSAEAAAALGIPAAEVEGRLHRARVALRELLAAPRAGGAGAFSAHATA